MDNKKTYVVLIQHREESQVGREYKMYLPYRTEIIGEYNTFDNAVQGITQWGESSGRLNELVDIGGHVRFTKDMRTNWYQLAYTSPRINAFIIPLDEIPKRPLRHMPYTVYKVSSSHRENHDDSQIVEENIGSAYTENQLREVIKKWFLELNISPYNTIDSVAIEKTLDPIINQVVYAKRPEMEWYISGMDVHDEHGKTIRDQYKLIVQRLG